MNAINNYLNRFKFNNEKNNDEFIHTLENKNNSQKKDKLEDSLLNQQKREKTEFQKEQNQKNLNNLNSNNYQNTKFNKKLKIEDVVDLIIDKPCQNDKTLDGREIKIKNNKKEKNKEICKLKTNPKYLIDKKYYKSDFEINGTKILNDKIELNTKLIEPGKEISIKIEGNQIYKKDEEIVNNNNKNNKNFVGIEYKTPFLNKTRYNLKRTLKFKNEDQNINNIKNIETNQKNEDHISRNEKEFKTKKIDTDNLSSGHKNELFISKEIKITKDE